jgi:SAM-dependent methyltransferase
VLDGFRVTGIDLSPGMVDEANVKFSHLPALEFKVADATDFELGRTFDASFSFFDSLNNILDLGDFERALARAFAHTKPGGVFIFDLNTELAFKEKLFDQEEMHPNSRLRYQWRGDYNPETRIIHVHMDFWLGDEHFTELHTQRAYRDDEVIAGLKKAGFTQITRYESYTLRKPRKKSDRIHYVALKPS